jgi:hypothetical protein
MLPLPSTATATLVSEPVPPKPLAQVFVVMEVAPACVTANVWPAIASVPLRELVLELAVTDHVTVPLPLPLAGVQVSQLVALLDAVHVQPAVVVTVTVPLPIPEPGLAPDAESA